MRNSVLEELRVRRFADIQEEMCLVCLSGVDARKVDALDQWCLRRILDIRWYHRVSNWEVRRLTEQPPLTTIIQKRRLTLFKSGQNGRVSRRQEISDCSSPERVEKASWATLHLLDSHSEERPSSVQPYLGGCYRTGSEYAAVETIGSKRSYALMVHAK